MKKTLSSLLLFIALYAGAQENPRETAQAFMRNGDFDNAILVLNRAYQQDKDNLDLQKDLTLAYYYKRDYAKALELVKPMLDRDDADVVSYQIAGNVYKALEEVKDADKMYKKAIKKFPKSGPLLSEYGELLWAQKDYNAINLWEKGIREDPGYSGNYYNAALFYFYTKDKIWSLIYGEIFLNMESLTDRSNAMKQLLYDGYKQKLFGDADLMKDQTVKGGDFAEAYLTTMGKQASVMNKGLNVETLTMVRTRFILDWYANYAAKFPFKLFDYQQQLIREGMWDAYNQWLFGPVENLTAFDNWSKLHADNYKEFTTFQRGRIFKMPSGQYYKN
jgi:tetratricopeptide (TPR) repeat protein